MRIQVIFGILWIFTQAAMGLLFQDPVVCRFTESNQCYVALGQRLHLPMPLEDQLVLKIIDKTSTPRFILRYRKTQSNSTKPKLPRWQFVIDSNTMILTSAERSDSGTYNLSTFDANGNPKGDYTLQLNTEAEVSSVKLSYSCFFPGVMEVDCSADGDNLRFNWTSDLNTLPQLENGNSTLTLNKDHHGKVTCHVENDVSYNYNTTELHPCPESTTSASTIAQFTNGKVPANGPTTAVVSSLSNDVDSSTQCNNGFMVFVSVWLFEILILLSLLVGAFYIYTRMYRKQKITASQEAL